MTLTPGADFDALQKTFSTWLALPRVQQATYVYWGEQHNDVNVIHFGISDPFTAAVKDKFPAMASEWPVLHRNAFESFYALDDKDADKVLRGAKALADRILGGVFVSELTTDTYRQQLVHHLMQTKAVELPIHPTDVRTSNRILFDAEVQAQVAFAFTDDVMAMMSNILIAGHNIGLIKNFRDHDPNDLMDGLVRAMIGYFAPNDYGGDLDQAIGSYIASIAGGRKLFIHGGQGHFNAGLSKGLGGSHKAVGIQAFSKGVEAFLVMAAQEVFRKGFYAPDFFVLEQNRIIRAEEYKGFAAIAKPLAKWWEKKYGEAKFYKLPTEVYDRLANPFPQRPGPLSNVIAPLVYNTPNRTVIEPK